MNFQHSYDCNLKCEELKVTICKTEERTKENDMKIYTSKTSEIILISLKIFLNIPLGSSNWQNRGKTKITYKTGRGSYERWPKMDDPHRSNRIEIII